MLGKNPNFFIFFVMNLFSRKSKHALKMEKVSLVIKFANVADLNPLGQRHCATTMDTFRSEEQKLLSLNPMVISSVTNSLNLRNLLMH